MKKRVVITGAAGFVGATLTRRLLKEGNIVHIMVRQGGSLWRLKEIQKDLVIHEGLLNKKKKLKQTLKKITPFAIYHLAAYGSYPFQKDLDTMIATNIIGTANLLSSSRDISYKCLLVAGSSSEYGKKDKPMIESDVLDPNNYYAATKAAQTHLCQAFAREENKPVTILRLLNVYGPLEEKGRLVRSVIEAVLEHRPILLSTGSEARDFIYVEDVADAFIRAANKKPFPAEIFNIGTGVETTTKELAELVIRLMARSVPIRLNVYPGRPWDTSHWRADMTKTNKILGWKPKYSLEEGLRKTIKWYRKE